MIDTCMTNNKSSFFKGQQVATRATLNCSGVRRKLPVGHHVIDLQQLVAFCNT